MSKSDLAGSPRSNIRTAVLDALLAAYAEGAWLTSRDIAKRVHTNYFQFYRKELERLGWMIETRSGRTPSYRLARDTADPSSVLPRGRVPGLREVQSRREEATRNRCDFCLRSGLPLQVDHAQPGEFFGTTGTTRWLLACRSCNTTKRTSGCRRCPNAEAVPPDPNRCDDCYWGNPASPFTHAGGEPRLVFPLEAAHIETARWIVRESLRTGQSIGAVLTTLVERRQS